MNYHWQIHHINIFDGFLMHTQRDNKTEGKSGSSFCQLEALGTLLKLFLFERKPSLKT